MPIIKLQLQQNDLESLPGWIISSDGLSIGKEFRFAQFDAAFDFMLRCYPIVNELNHHLDWLNSYNLVKVSLTTHDVGGLSQKDLELAEAMNQVFKLLS